LEGDSIIGERSIFRNGLSTFKSFLRNMDSSRDLRCRIICHHKIEGGKG
jgi:hypothetical protein